MTYRSPRHPRTGSTTDEAFLDADTRMWLSFMSKIPGHAPPASAIKFGLPMYFAKPFRGDTVLRRDKSDRWCDRSIALCCFSDAIVVEQAVEGRYLEGGGA